MQRSRKEILWISKANPNIDHLYITVDILHNDLDVHSIFVSDVKAFLETGEQINLKKETIEKLKHDLASEIKHIEYFLEE